MHAGFLGENAKFLAAALPSVMTRLESLPGLAVPTPHIPRPRLPDGGETIAFLEQDVPERVEHKYGGGSPLVSHDLSDRSAHGLIEWRLIPLRCYSSLPQPWK